MINYTKRYVLNRYLKEISTQKRASTQGFTPFDGRWLREGIISQTSFLISETWIGIAALTPMHLSASVIVHHKIECMQGLQTIDLGDYSKSALTL